MQKIGIRELVNSIIDKVYKKEIPEVNVWDYG